MPSLTRDDARLRAELLTVHRYVIDLDLDRGPETFHSRSVVTFEAAENAETFVDVKPDTLVSVTLDGQPLDVGLLDDGRFLLQLSAGTHELDIAARMAYSNDGEGLHRSVDTADGRAYLYAMSFLDAAPRIFGCFDQPDLKAPYSITVKTPADWTVLGNGRALPQGDGLWRLTETLPLSTYFVTLVAGPYHSLVREHDGIWMGLHVKQSLAEHLDKDVDHLFRITAQCFDEYHRLFGIRYPFGDYHQCFVPEFNAGAMENPGCVTFRDGLVFRSAVPDSERVARDLTIAHEMAHQWFGDLVTMQWWDDLWLNESFAEYMAYRVCDDATDVVDPWVDFGYSRKRWGMTADQRRSTHPVAGNGAADAQTALTDFDGISYAKGASALRQLAAFVGDEVFITGVRSHFTEHAYGNATLHDLFSAWERAGAHDLQGWAKGWLRTPGLDTLAVDGDELVRTPPVDHPAERPHALTVARFGTEGGMHDAAVTVQSDRTPLPFAPAPGAVLVPDALDQTWAKLRFDEHTLAVLSDRIATLPTLSRAAAWLGISDAAADGDVTPAYALRLAEALLPAETSDIGIRVIGSWADRVLVGQYLDGDREAYARIGAALQVRLATAPEGSGLQVATARQLVTVTRDPDLLSGWLDGKAPDGLAMDADMRWSVLTQLARIGAVGDDAVSAEEERDSSSQGRVSAIQARASMPDADQKARAWAGITTEQSLSNYDLYAMCEGFWQPEQSALTDAYVPRYFAEIPRTMDLRSGWVVAETARLAFPRFAVSERTVQAADDLAADESVHPGLRRSVADGADDMRRALAARQG